MEKTLSGLREGQTWKLEGSEYTLTEAKIQWLDKSPIVLLVSETEPEGGWWIGLDRLRRDAQLLHDAPEGTPDIVAVPVQPPQLRDGRQLSW